MVKRLDEALGRLQDALHSLGIADNTIVAFTSDHACHFTTRNSEYKRSCHDSSIRVPCGLWGGPFNGGGAIPQLVSLVDLPPTLLDAAQIPIPKNIQGRSFLPLLGGRSPKTWPEEIFVRISEGQTGRAIRTHRWKYAVTADAQGPDGKPLVSAHAYTESHLYDLESDPHELTNLVQSSAYAEIRTQLRRTLLKRIRDAGEPLPKIAQLPPHNGGARAPSLKLAAIKRTPQK